MRISQLTIAIFTPLFALWLTACGSSSPSATQDPPVSPSEASALQSALDQAVSDSRVPGAVMAVRTPEGKVWKGASGVAVYETNTSMDTSMHLHIGSVTKTYTATAILMLIDQKTPIGNGKTLSLDSTLYDVLPELHMVNEHNITVTDLLDMKSGLNEYSTRNPAWLAAFEADPGRIWLPEELAADSNSSDNNDTIGVTYHYSNGNFVLLGIMIEKLTGMSYADAIKKMILDPMHLDQTSVPSDARMPSPYASGYLLNDSGQRINATFMTDPSWGWSAGSIISTVSDQLKWAQILADGTLLSPAMREARLPAAAGYGLGIVDLGGNGKDLGHNGNYNGIYTAWVFRYHGYDVAILSNGQATGGDDHSTATQLFYDINATLGW